MFNKKKIMIKIKTSKSSTGEEELRKYKKEPINKQIVNAEKKIHTISTTSGMLLNKSSKLLLKSSKTKNNVVFFSFFFI